MLQNRLVLTATVAREEVLRYTPAQVPILEMWLSHHSWQREAGADRAVSCDIQAVMVGEAVRPFVGKLAGASLRVSGFLSQRSWRNPRLVLHIDSAEFV